VPILLCLLSFDGKAGHARLVGNTTTKNNVLSCLGDFQSYLVSHDVEVLLRMKLVRINNKYSRGCDKRSFASRKAGLDYNRKWRRPMLIIKTFIKIPYDMSHPVVNTMPRHNPSFALSASVPPIPLPAESLQLSIHVCRSSQPEKEIVSIHPKSCSVKSLNSKTSTGIPGKALSPTDSLVTCGPIPDSRSMPTERWYRVPIRARRV